MNIKQQKIISRLEVFWPQIKLLQESYLSNYGKYFQGLASHEEIPDGENFENVNLKIKPTDFEHDYEDFWRRIHKTESEVDGELVIEDFHEFGEEVLDSVQSFTTSIRFNISEGINGKNWEIALNYKEGNDLYEYRRDKNDNITDWYIVEEIEV